MQQFAGRWQTTFGLMDLTQQNNRVRGTYLCMGQECRISGRIAHGKFTFKYDEPAVSGEGWFSLTRHGQAFAGQFREPGGPWQPWEGERIGFDGLWNTSFGLMRLNEHGDEVHGHYEVGGHSTIDGKRKGNQLTFRYKEPVHGGRGRFVLADDGLSFQGEWKQRGETHWKPWQGIRVRPQRDLSWLVVLEAPWQRLLSDREYSFGNMLREFFARVDGVQVRHRFFANEAGLRKCIRDLHYIAEPVVLVLATHARPDGISVDGQTIGVPVLLDALRHAGNLRLVHFSACLLMQDAAVVKQLRDFSVEARLPISGYSTSVDWAASAIIEFTFLDLLLARGLDPAAASEQLMKLLPFAGNDEIGDVALRPAGFSIVLPDQRKPSANGAAKGKKRSRVV